MKKYFIFFILLFFISISDVFAFNEYSISIGSDNNMVVKNETGTKLNASVYQDLINYDKTNKLLTLAEDVHVYYLGMAVSVTITTNGKMAYINHYKNTSTTTGANNLTIENSKLSTYNSTYSTKKTYGSYIGKNMFYISGNITIKDSMVRIDKQDGVDGFDGAMLSWKNTYIVNSTIEVYKYIFSDGDLIIQDSTIKDTDQEIRTQIYGQGQSDSNFEINNSNIEIVGWIFGYGNVNIIKSSIHLIGDNKNNYITGNSLLNIYESDYEGPSIICSNECIMKKSNITLLQWLAVRKDITIENSILKNEGVIDIYEKAYFKDSEVEAKNIGTPETTYVINSYYLDNSKVYVSNNTYIQGDLEINNNSIFKTNNIEVRGNFSQNDSIFDLYKTGVMSFDVEGKANLAEVNYKFDHLKSGSLILDDSQLEIKNDFIINGDAEINETNINTNKSVVIKGNLVLNDSYLNTDNENDKTLTPLIIKGDLLVNNSRIKVASKGNVPAAMFAGNVDLGNFVFEDNEGNKLTILPTVVSNDNFLSNDEMYTNANYMSINDNVKTIGLNDEITKEVDYIGGFYEVTLKIVNGSLDNKKEIIIKVPYGEEFNEDYLPDGILADNGFYNGKLSLKEDGTYEYVFGKKPIVVTNPKTGVISTIPFTIIAFIGMILLGYTINKLSKFKKI